uniref:FGENESH: predicted gene_1.595 protein n=1 Tax=Rhodotorula toruloides TaxID=5286 RepID=A0A0K3C503_RHOTO
MAAQGDDSDAESDCSALSSLSALDARWSPIEEPAPPPLVPSEAVAPTTRLQAVMDVEQEEECLGHDQRARAGPSTRRSTRSSLPVSPDAKIGEVDSGSEPSRRASEVVGLDSGIAKPQADGPAKLAKEDQKRSKSKKRLAPRDDDEYEGRYDPELARRSSMRNRKSRGRRQADSASQITPTPSALSLDESRARTDVERPRTKRPRPSEADMLLSSAPEATVDLAGLTRRTAKLLEVYATSSARPAVALSVDTNKSIDSASGIRPSSKKERRKERVREEKRAKPSREQAELSRDFFACSSDLLSDDDAKPSTRSSKRLRSSIALSTSAPLSPVASTSTAQPHADELESIESRALGMPKSDSREDSTEEERKDGEGSSRPRREVAELSRDIWASPSESLVSEEKPTTRASKRLRLAERTAADSTDEDGGLPLGEPPAAPLPPAETLAESTSADTMSADGTASKQARRKERKTKEERKKAKKGSGGAAREVADLRRDFFSVSDVDALAEESGRSTRKSKRRCESSMVVSPPDPAPTPAAPATSSVDMVVDVDHTGSTTDAMSPEPSTSLLKRSSRQRRLPARYDDDPDRFTIVRNAEIFEEQELRARMRKASAAKATSSTMWTGGPSQPGETSRQLAQPPSRPTLPSLAETGLLTLPIKTPRKEQHSPAFSAPSPLTTMTPLARPAASVSAPTAPVKKTKKARRAVPIVPTDPSTSLSQPATTAAPVETASDSVSEAPPAVPAPNKAPKQSQATKTRIRHPALDSRASWVEPEKNLTLTTDGRPPIWCEGRQELCETLNYFKAYQGGHYDSQERCLGYLLDGFGSANDVCTNKGKIVISQCVPARTIKTSNASYIYRLKSSQTRDNLRLRALFNCLETQTPVVLLAGAGWTFFPKLSSLGSSINEDGEEVDKARYAVLGHYLVTDIWPEGEPIEDDGASKGKDKPGHFVRFKVRFLTRSFTHYADAPALYQVRFEWVPSQGKPWFEDHIGVESISKEATPEPSSPASDAASLDSGFVDITEATAEQASVDEGCVTCEACHQTHRRVYQENVSCYNEACSNFFLVDGEMHHPSSLTYQPSILAPSDLPQDTLVPQSLFPRTLQSLAGEVAAADYSAEAWRGFGCTACGRLSSRADWIKLKCAGCGAEGNAVGKAFTIQDLRAEERLAAIKAGKIPPSDYKPVQPVFVEPSMRVRPILHIPGWQGYTVEMLPSVTSEDAEDSTASCSSVAVGGLLCQQFTFNAGEHYRNAITATTYPFPPTALPSSSVETPVPDDETTYAPECTREARNHLKTVVQLLVGPNELADFNEILSVAYMSGGKMNYHDDGERGLGPYVASVSLGSDALMTFRAKGKKKTRAFGGGAGQTGKKAKGATSTGDEPEETEEGEGRKADKTKRIVCKMRLRHGDVMVMEGEEMQRLFEHKVEPEGLRYAATARFVGPDHLNPAPKSRPQPVSTGARFAYQDAALTTATPAPSNIGASTSKAAYAIPLESKKPAGVAGWQAYVQQEDAQFFPSTNHTAIMAHGMPGHVAPTFVPMGAFVFPQMPMPQAMPRPF